MDFRIIVVSSLFLAAAGLAGGIAPFYLRLKEGGLHYLLSLGTGMLLGTVFLHMLPEAMTESGSPILVLVGLLLVFIVERLVFGGVSHEDTHRLIGLTAYFGLSVHCFIVGLGLAAELEDPITRTALMASLMVHKLSEAFSLATVFILAGYSRRRALNLMCLFSLVTPAGLWLSYLMLGAVPARWGGTASGLAAGTFLYVALVDLLPEVFHHPKGRWKTLALLVVGICLIWALLSAGGEPGHLH